MPVFLHTDAGVVEAPSARGRRLTEIAEDAGLILNTRCGGEGVCGGCAVRLEEGEYRVGDEPVRLREGESREALACRTRVLGESARVWIPRSSLLEGEAVIDEGFSVGGVRVSPRTGRYCLSVPPAGSGRVPGLWESARAGLAEACGGGQLEITPAALRALPAAAGGADGRVTFTVDRRGRIGRVFDVEPGDKTAVHVGAAVDVGTTTVVAMLVDLDRGAVLGKASRYNQQIRRADDVASRISHARTPAAVRELQQLVIDRTINPLLGALCRAQGLEPRQVCRITVSGNTVMAHLVLGLSPAGIGVLPFQPVTNHPEPVAARELGLAIHPDGLVEFVPSIAGYVGGDIVSDLYVSRLRRRPGLNLLVDIGTNAEIVLSDGHGLVACAAAAGPAFEGYGIAQGCRAAAGAIAHLRFDRCLAFSADVIGGVAPTGFCGSAVIDFLAEGRRCGLINALGRFDVGLLRDRGRHLLVDAPAGPSHACRIVGAEASGLGRPLFLSEADIAQVLKAKAAVYAGMRTLLEARGRTWGEVGRLFLAGGFARHIDLGNARVLGLLPDIPAARIEIIGNGSLAGAYAALVDRRALAACARLAQLPETLELNLQPTFAGHFVEALAIPHLDAAEFPSVVRQLRGCRAAGGSGESSAGAPRPPELEKRP